MLLYYYIIIETKTKNTFPSLVNQISVRVSYPSQLRHVGPYMSQDIIRKAYMKYRPADDSLSATKFYPHRIIVPTVFMIRDHALAFVAAWLLSGSKWRLFQM